MSIIQIIDDVLPQSYADELEYNFLKSTNFDWYLIEDIAYTKTPEFDSLKEEDMRPGFTHSLLMDNYESKYFGMCKIIPHLAVARSSNPDFRFYYMKARAFLQMPTSNITHNNIHTDAKTPHMVCLYYINDSSGDTLLFDNEHKNVIGSVSPKKNRAILFNGLIPHCSTPSEKTKRAVINFNLVR